MLSRRTNPCSALPIPSAHPLDESFPRLSRRKAPYHAKRRGLAYMRCLPTSAPMTWQGPLSKKKKAATVPQKLIFAAKIMPKLILTFTKPRAETSTCAEKRLPFRAGCRIFGYYFQRAKLDGQHISVSTIFPSSVALRSRVREPRLPAVPRAVINAYNCGSAR